MAKRARKRQSAIRPGVLLLGGLGKSKPGYASPGGEAKRNPQPSAAEQAEHQGRTPMPGVPAGPRDTQLPSASGYEYPASTYETHPSLTPPAPQRIPKPTFSNQVPISGVLERAVDLLTPGPTAKEIAVAAHALGVQPTEPTKPKPVTRSSLENLGHLIGSLSTGHLPSLPKVAVPQQGGRSPAQGPGRGAMRGRDPLGKKTLGNATQSELVRAQREGKLQVSKGGQITTPKVRHALLQLHQAKVRYDKTNGVQGPFTRGQKLFVEEFVRLTGMDPRVVGAWTLQEEGPGANEDRERENNQNWLNVKRDTVGESGGVYDWTPVGSTWRDPRTAAKAAADNVLNSGFYNDSIVPAIQGTPQQQLAAIAASPWGTGSISTANQVSLQRDPQAAQALAVAKRQAKSVGLNPTPWNGDVAGGGQEFAWVRGDAKGMVQWAESALGTQEGTGRQLRWAGRFGLGELEPWCANFVSNGLLRRGFSPAELPANPNNTGTPGYEQWAQEGKYATNIGTDLAKAKPGDVLAFSGAHTALYVGNGEMVSGNFSDEVERTSVSAGPAPLSMIIRPKYKGGKVKVADSTMIGTGTTEAVGGVGGGEALSGGVPAVGEPGSGGGRQRAQGHVFPAAEVPISQLLQTLALTPRASLQGSLAEESEPTGTIGRLLAQRRL